MKVDLDAVFTILVEECGLRDSIDGLGISDRWAFITAIEPLLESWPLEYRFIGALGFGGKLRYDPFQSRYQSGWFVTCYREDETPERLAMIWRANRRLAEEVAA